MRPDPVVAAASDIAAAAAAAVVAAAATITASDSASAFLKAAGVWAQGSLRMTHTMHDDMHDMVTALTEETFSKQKQQPVIIARRHASACSIIINYQRSSAIISTKQQSAAIISTRQDVVSGSRTARDRSRSAGAYVRSDGKGVHSKVRRPAE